MSALDEAIELALEDLQDSENIIGSDPGPLVNPELSTVTNKLSSAQFHITNALGIIFNDGTADTSGLPATLPLIAGSCVELADEAYKESLEGAPDRDYIGDRLKTITWRFDATNGYRAKAGIT